MSKIVTFGEIMLRLAPNGFNRFFQNDQMQASFGGAEANVAVSLANFGESVAFVSKTPDNAIGQGAIDSLRYFGVDTASVARGGDRLGIYFLEKGANQRGSVCIYDRTDSAFAKAEKNDFDWDKIFHNTDWFHFTGITPALSDNTAELCLDACMTAKKKKITISSDLNFRAKLWSKDKAKKTMTELCKYVDVCIANEEDAKSVFGIESANTDVYSGKINKSGYEYVARKLKSLFDFSYVAFTLRTSHSATVNDWAGMLFDGNNCYYSSEYHFDSIVDRVGGGDSFGAGLIYSLRNKFDPQKAIDFAVAASALKHSIEGDFNRISVNEVEKLVNGDASGRVQR